MFDTFMVKNAKCNLCGHVFDGDFQTKDFGCTLDFVSQGENVKTAERECGFIFKDNGFWEYFTLTKAKRIVGRWPTKFKLTYEKNGLAGGRDYVRVDRYFGKRHVNMSGIVDAEFNMYTSCPKCHGFFETIGVIKDSVFLGQKELKREDSE